MKSCKKCDENKSDDEFYNRDNTCKECRKAMVRENRSKNIDYYREYDKKRFQNDPKVKQRHLRYQSTEAGKKSIRKAKDKYIEKNPVKRAAHVILGNAVRDGRINKPSACQACGAQKGRIHGHHNDYAKPLSVIWLCSKCHQTWHDKNGEGLNAH